MFGRAARKNGVDFPVLYGALLLLAIARPWLRHWRATSITTKFVMMLRSISQKQKHQVKL